MEKGKHFILVHGACHGAWSWYKLATLLTSAGHRVTTVDLAASGINQKIFKDEVQTFSDYSQPLLEIMASLPLEERAILVGHSLGGLNLALAMEKFPEKVSVAVFVTAFMPDTSNRPSDVLDKFLGSIPLDLFLDTEFKIGQGPGKPSTMFFGPKFMEEKLYQLSPPEDLTLGKSLIRVSSLFREDLSNAPNFSKEKYGSVSRVYIICKEDKGIVEDFQRLMIETYPVNEVKVIEGSDHMPMFSKPKELYHCLLDIAKTYS